MPCLYKRQTKYCVDNRDGLVLALFGQPLQNAPTLRVLVFRAVGSAYFVGPEFIPVS